MLRQNKDRAKLIVKHFPLNSHRNARKAAFAALAAEKQGKYQPYIRMLLQNYKKLNENSIKELARKAGLNMQQFEKDQSNPYFFKIINQDKQLGLKSKVHGVPAVFIGGRKVKNWSLKALRLAIEKEMAKR